MISVSAIEMEGSSYVFQYKGDLERQQGLEFRFPSFHSRPEAALGYLAMHLADLEEVWIHPRREPSGPWILHLDRVAEHFDLLASQEWLRGDRYLMPLSDELSGNQSMRGVVQFFVPREEPPMQEPLHAAPESLTRELTSFHVDHPDVGRCGFLMMSFSDSRGHGEISAAVKSTCEGFGLKALRADDYRYADEFFPNIKTYMHGCSFGIAVFERVEAESFNPNVALEVGYMLALGKPVCLLKERTLKALHGDLVGHLYEVFGLDNIETSIPVVLGKWLRGKGLIRDY